MPARPAPEYQKAQAELVSSHIAKQDIVITTALIPGRPAPRLISDAQLASMRTGSIVVDLAAEAGGNVEGVAAGKTVVRHGVTIVGAVQLARTLAADSSALFARNLYNFLERLLGQGGRKARASRRRRDRQGAPSRAGAGAGGLAAAAG